MTTAKEAYECAEAILKSTASKKFREYLGEWNTLMLYLGEQVRKESAASG